MRGSAEAIEKERPGSAGYGRRGKKQIVCFLTAEANALAHGYALRQGITRQALLARALNAALRDMGASATLRESMARPFCVTRHRKRRYQNPYGRYGKSALAGWFPQIDVISVSAALMACGSNFQVAIERGLMLLGILTRPALELASDAVDRYNHDDDVSPIARDATADHEDAMPDLADAGDAFPEF